MKVVRYIFPAAVLVLAAAEPAAAYIGPGAGFAFISSFFVLFMSLIAALLILLTAPVRFIVRASRGRRRIKAKCNRLVILGLDGLDPGLAAEMMERGELPNLKSLADSGSFAPLETTCPPISPVAWSSFMTGTTPARHNIFDFLVPDRKTYFPKLSSSEIRPSDRTLKIGPYSIPIGRPVLRLLRKGKPFWRILGENGVYSSVLRVPITFPPEPFGGHLLSAMCVPDLRGTQGSFTFFTGAAAREDVYEGGERVRVSVADNRVESFITGPANPVKSGGEMTLPFTVQWQPGAAEAVMKLGGAKIRLKVGVYTGWTRVEFRAGPGVKVAGICRFYLKSLEPEFGLYVSPINIDPGRPALPISHPFVFSVYLSKMLGPFATLGLAEDTWALNERILDERSFLDQTYMNHAEREKMFFHALERTRRGVCVCVFDTTDRIQHMFWRYHEKCDHQITDGYETYRDTVRELYRRMDGLVGRTAKKLGDKDVLIVMSDHGFKAFRRGVDLNAWLEKSGYLARRDGGESACWPGNVDWLRTRAYALGLAGVYINMKGRERHGIVDPADAQALRDGIAAAITGLRDDETGETAVVNAYDPHRIQSGPYLDEGPDIVVGYNSGYRVSWDCAMGKIGDSVFSDNTKSWSGDHCVDPALVPGSFFCSLKLNGRAPRMIDIAPSALSLFGILAPANMEGTPLFD